MHTTELGTLGIPIGKYDSKKTYREDHPDPAKRGQPIMNFTRTHVGKLMETVHSDGTTRRWLSIDASTLNPSLLMLAMKAGAVKQDGRITIDVFEPRPDDEPSKPRTQTPAQPEDEDGIPF